MVSRQILWQRRQQDAGKCVTCGRKAGQRNKKYCEYHRRRNLEYARRRYLRVRDSVA